LPAFFRRRQKKKPNAPSRASPPRTPPTIPPIAPPERPLSSAGAGLDEGKLVVDAVTDAGPDEGANVDDEGRSFGSTPVNASNCCLLIPMEVAVGLADKSEEYVWFNLVALRDRSPLSPLLQQMLNCLSRDVQSSLLHVSGYSNLT
jgi:hypothetical protein